MTDDISYRKLADHLASAEDAAAALAAGHLTLTFDDAQAPQRELPPPGAPVSVVRPVRLPYEVDAAVKAIAEARGITVSALIREWVQNGLASAGANAGNNATAGNNTNAGNNATAGNNANAGNNATAGNIDGAGNTAGDAPDPVAELRQGLNSALRALDSLTARGIRPAA